MVDVDSDYGGQDEKEVCKKDLKKKWNPQNIE